MTAAYLVGLFAGGSYAAPFSITEARWDQGDQRLSVRGAGTNRSTVVVTDAATGVTMGSQRVDEDRWRVRRENPPTIPCRVRAAQSDGAVAERDVENRPASCNAVTPNLSINDVTVAEGGTANFAVALSVSPSNAVTVNFATANGSATAGSDYTARSGTLTFPAGTSTLTQTVAVTTLNDTVAEGNETFSVNLSGAVNATIADAQGVGTITNVAPPAQPSLSINDVTVTEGQTANFTVTLSAPSTQTVTVIASTANGTAAAPSDFTARSNVTVSFPAGTTTQTFAVNTVNDAVAEQTESFTVNLSGAVNATIADAQGVGTINDNDQAANVPNVSINSTSQNRASIPTTVVDQQQRASQPGYQVFAVNDLGMHCGDLDTRVASILPPFNVVHAQVVRQGSNPTRLGENQVILEYSAASNPNDPVLNNSGAFLDPNFKGVYKTNFWDNGRALQAYGPFYPPLNIVDPSADPSRSLLEAFYSPTGSFDLGLPVPDLELLYLATPSQLVADQQSMPSETFRNPATGSPLNARDTAPFVANAPQRFQQFVGTQVFFTNPAFKFGYTAPVEWHEAAGVPIATFDDVGRENAYPLMRVQAKAAPGNTLGVSAGTVLSSVDTVLPVSGEADCRACHAAPVDGGNGSGTQALVTAGVALKTSLDDNEFVSGAVPLPVAVEWATDHNILALHNLKHTGTSLTPPVVCQTCHYTPALDLAQVGPQDTSNGRAQVKHNTKTMSNVMHASHARLAQGKTDGAGNPLFPSMPSPVGRNRADAQSVLENTCYLCHPGKRTQCLRGAMGQAGVVCQDCHGNMTQVGTDFSNNRPTGGNFVLAADFYTNPNTPRVPWANEPGCGSCHTGDVRANGRPGTPAGQSYVVAPDGIRLLQAFRTGDAKATPIVPTNKRFAESVITTSENNQGAAGNPKLYRVSTGHGGMFCEACHGSTHAEWSSNPVATKVNANDNVTSSQIQGHAGTIIECQTCHGTAMNNTNTLNGPHGMHPVGDQNGNRFVNGGHENLAEQNPNACRACHGNRGEGTVLSMTKADRRLDGRTIPKGTAIGCGLCHENELR